MGTAEAGPSYSSSLLTESRSRGLPAPEVALGSCLSVSAALSARFRFSSTGISGCSQVPPAVVLISNAQVADVLLVAQR